MTNSPGTVDSNFGVSSGNAAASADTKRPPADSASWRGGIAPRRAITRWQGIVRSPSWVVITIRYGAAAPSALLTLLAWRLFASAFMKHLTRPPLIALVILAAFASLARGKPLLRFR